MDGLNVVRFRDARHDFDGVADLVDEYGAVVITRHGQPAYVLADYDDVTVNEECCGGDDECCRGEQHGRGPGGPGHGRPGHGPGGHGPGGHGHGGPGGGGCHCGCHDGKAAPGGDHYSANTGKCDCGAGKGTCDCGKHPAGEDTAGSDGAAGTGRYGRGSRPVGEDTSGSDGAAGTGYHRGPDAGDAPHPPRSHRPDWQRPNERHADRRRREWEDDPRSKNYEWAERKIREFERAARKRHEEGGGPGFGVPPIPGFLPTEFVGIVPDEVIEAGEQIVNKLANIFGAFGVIPTDDNK